MRTFRLAAAGLLAVTLVGAGDPATAAPPGSTFAFLQTSDGGRTYSIYAADSPLAPPRRVTARRAVGRPALSPDGKRVVFTSPLGDDSDGRYGLYVVGLNGFGLRQLTAPAYTDFDPAWSPDGQFLAFARDVAGSSDPLTCCQLVISRSNGSAARALPGILGASYPAWSPDGSRLSFVTPRGLWLVDRTGAGLRRIVEGPVSQPAWSPDGRQIAYTQRTTEDQTQLRVIGSSGGRPSVRHAVNGHVDSPHWDTDSRALYFISHRGAGEDSRVSSAIHVQVPGQRARRLSRYQREVFYLAFAARKLQPGTTTIGLARTSGALYDWSLANAPSGADLSRGHRFGPAGSTPVAGDWNGDGTVSSGFVTRNKAGTSLLWYLSNNNRTVIAPFEYGAAADRPIVGDWDGDGRWTVGVARTQDGRLRWLLSDDNRMPRAAFVYGFAGDQIVAGDWNYDGVMTVGTVRPVQTNLAWYLSDDNRTIARRFTFGVAGASRDRDDRVVAGDWNGDGRWTAGLVRVAGPALQWVLTDDDRTVSQDFLAGVPGDFPVVGNWDGS